MTVENLRFNGLDRKATSRMNLQALCTDISLDLTGDYTITAGCTPPEYTPYEIQNTGLSLAVERKALFLLMPQPMVVAPHPGRVPKLVLRGCEFSNFFIEWEAIVFFQDSLNDVPNRDNSQNLVGKGGHLQVDNCTFRDSWFSRGAIASYPRISVNYYGIEDTCTDCYSVAIYGGSYFINVYMRGQFDQVRSLSTSGGETWVTQEI